MRCATSREMMHRGSWHRYSLRKTEMSALLCADTGLKGGWDGEGSKFGHPRGGGVELGAHRGMPLSPLLEQRRVGRRQGKRWSDGGIDGGRMRWILGRRGQRTRDYLQQWRSGGGGRGMALNPSLARLALAHKPAQGPVPGVAVQAKLSQRWTVVGHDGRGGGGGRRGDKGSVQCAARRLAMVCRVVLGGLMG